MQLEANARNDVSTQNEKYNSFIEFEERCEAMSHSVCLCCHTASLKRKVNKKNLCVTCASHKDIDYYLKRDALPVWYEDGKKTVGYDRHLPQYHVPFVLWCLSTAEKMLIQRLSPIVPLHHIKKGVCGIKGHVCTFEQDIDEFVQRLPRSKGDTTLLRVIKTIKSEVGDVTTTNIKSYIVRKERVLNALLWLKKNNPLYYDIVIDMSNLDWIDGEEGVLDNTTIETEVELRTRSDMTHENSDMGPAADQAFGPEENEDNIQQFGYLDQGGSAALSAEDAEINDKIQDAVRKSPNKDAISMDFPAVSSVPISEFGDKKIFALSFPWLFPGGIGDVNDFPGQPGTWGRTLLLYKDGRFAKDPIFCFYALNFIIRQRNNRAGQWFVTDFNKNSPQNLDELHDRIANGDTSFANCINYYNARCIGSGPYWEHKRREVYTWINYHIGQGNGAPMYFITLSCAEYFWADVVKLLKERLEIAGKDPTKCAPGQKGWVEFVNDYSIVIQEYFQLRTEAWLQTVGKDIFGIKHYWVRYEFAPGRGQIHAHLLAIPEDQSIYELAYNDTKEPNGKTKRAERMAAWAEAKFGLTATVDDGFDDIAIDGTNTPTRNRFKDLPADIETSRLDRQKLMKAVQCHKCSKFCLREKYGNKYVIKNGINSGTDFITIRFHLFSTLVI